MCVCATGCHSQCPNGQSLLLTASAWQVVAITRPSRRRGAVVGVLREEGAAGGGGGLLFLMPRDARLPRAVVQVGVNPGLSLADSSAPVVLMAVPAGPHHGLGRLPASLRLIRWWHAPCAWSRNPQRVA